MTREGITERLVDGVAIQRVDATMMEDCEHTDYEWCNMSNHKETALWEHWKDQGIQDKMYREIMDKTRMNHWLPVFEDSGCMRKPLATFVITAKQQKRFFKQRLIRNCARMGERAGNLYGEEAEDLAKEIMDRQQNTNHPIPNPPRGGWFVRTTACSPKDAQMDNGAGPHYSLKSVISALFASERVHVAMREYDKDETVYLLPFDRDVAVERELRVFVYQNKVTAISQYDVLNSCGAFTPMSDEQLKAVAHSVKNFHEKEILPRWKRSDNYVLDLEYVAPHKQQKQNNAVAKPVIRLIELNSFGAEMAAASSLFHWIDDYDELYSSTRLCIRVRGIEKKE